MRPTAYEAAHVQSTRKLASTLRPPRPRRRSLIGRTRASSVPYSAGSLGSWRQQTEENDDQLIVSMKEPNTLDGQTGMPIHNNSQALHEYLMVLTPQCLPYEIQMASGWDKGFPPEELVGLMQTSVGKGWHTPRFCGYPQDLVLRFTCGHCRVRKIQILSHQYKIANRLDIWMGSRKGVQSINTDSSEPGSHAGGDPISDRDSSYIEQETSYEEEDDGLGLIPKMETKKRSIPVLQFQKLGSISFDSNTASNFSGRELKSINVDVEGEYLRVVIRQCHVNPLNIYHQVAILALNVLGEPLEDELQGESERLDFDECEVVNGPGQGFSEPSLSLAHSLVPITESQEAAGISEAVRGLSISDIKDQSVSYMDHEIQMLVSGFVKAKQDAVKVEDFSSAKQYKAGYDGLIKFADEIQVLDIEKQRAAENDEFDLAQELKAKVMEVKERMNSQLTLSGFRVISNNDETVISLNTDNNNEDIDHFEKDTRIHKSYSAGDTSMSADPRNSSSGSISASGKRPQSTRKSIPPVSALNRSFSAASDNSSDPEKSKKEYSGRIPMPLPRSQSQPTGLSKHSNETRIHTAELSQRGGAPSPSVNPKSPRQTTVPNVENDRSFRSTSQLFGQDEISGIQVDELTHQEQISFAASLQVFSSKVVSCLVSRDLQLRLYAIEHVKEHLENENGADEVDQEGDKTLLARAVFQVISIALTDTREKVVTLALALLDQVVKFCFQNEISNLVVYRSLEPIFSLLLVKASDLNTRISQGTIDRIVMLCNCYTTSPYAILPLVFKPARSTVLYRQSQSRIQIVARLVDEFGVYDRAEGKGTVGGLDLESITEFAIPYLSHTNGEVRIATRKLIIDVCKFLNKTRVEQFLPGVKPLIIESIQKELVPKKARAQLANTSTHPRLGTFNSTSNTSTTTTTSTNATSSTRLAAKSTGLGAGSGKRRQVSTPLGVDLHMDSLKSLLVEPPESPGLPKTSRQTLKQKSDASVAHHARLKMPLRSSIKATQALYVGVPKAMVKKQSALSPEDDNDSTASDEVKLPLSKSASPSRSLTRATQSKSKSGSSLTPKSSTQNLHSESRASDEPTRPNEERFCVFCDEHSNAFTDEGLVAHYWNECAMLANCSYCKIIIEVPTLSEHMIKECPKRKFVKKCDNCREIMSADSYLAHVASGCFAAPEDIAKCPLCHEVLPSNDEADWKEHLLGGSGCPSNKKTKGKPVPSAKPTAKTSRVVTPVSIERGYSTSKPVPKESPSSPLSSSSSASMRIETTESMRHRSALLSSTVSPASSTTSSVIAADKGDYSHYSAGPLLVPLTLPSASHQAHHRSQQDVNPIHPLDPCPTVASHPESPNSTHSAGNVTLGGNGNSSRIPKLGSVRSTSSNSVASSSWK